MSFRVEYPSGRACRTPRLQEHTMRHETERIGFGHPDYIDLDIIGIFDLGGTGDS